MKKIAIISAMDVELKPILKLYPNAKQINKTTWKTILNDKEVYFGVCGIGKANMAGHVGWFISEYKVEHIINVGVAGSLTPKVKTLDIVSATAVAHHDFNLTKFGFDHGQVPDFDTHMKSPKVFDIGTKGLIVCGDIFAEKAEIAVIKKHFPDAIAVEMEGAALAQIASKFNVDWSAIRIISDDGSMQKYEELKEQASNMLAQKISDIVANL